MITGETVSPDAQDHAARMPRPRRRWKASHSHVGPLLALTAIHVIVFARSLFYVLAGLFIVPWDFQNSYHRFLVYAGDCFRNGTLPLWNPYNAAGTPFFIHPQSQMWSPVTLLVGATFGYTHDLAQRQLILTVLLGGVGAYLLSFSIWRSRSSAFVSALCFDLTSAVFSNMEHMDIINAYALLPWLFWAANMAVERRRWSLPLLSFLLYWLVTWGYPAVVAMGVAWLAAYWLFLAFTRAREWRGRWQFLARGAMAGTLGLGLSAVHWLPILAHRAAFVRGAPMDIDAALDGGLTFGHLWGLLFNFMTRHVPEGSSLDLSMVGVYLGVVAIPCVAAALLRDLDRERSVCMLAVGAGAALLMSMGAWFFVRYTMHWLIPAMNVSRVPAADSRTLMVLCLALLAGRGAWLVIHDAPGARQIAARVTGAVLVALLAGLVVWRGVAYRQMPQSTYFHAVVNGITAQLVFLLTFLVALARQPPVSARTLGLVLAGVLVLDLGTDVTLNYDLVGQRISRPEHRAREAAYRHDFDLKAASRPRIVVKGKQPGDDHDEWSMLGLTHKEFYLNDYGGFRLIRFDHLLRSGFGPWLADGPRVTALPPGAAPNSYTAFAAAASPVEFRILSYRPTEVRYEVDTDRDVLLVFNEVAFPGWEATVGSTTKEMQEVAGGLRALDVSAGHHEIVTRFRPRILRIAMYVSVAAVLVLLGWIMRSLWR